MDTAGNAMNGDVAGAVESGAKTVKETKKTVKKTEKALISKILMIATPVLIFFVILVVILSPVMLNLDQQVMEVMLALLLFLI